MDRNGYPFCGSLDEQERVRRVFATYAPWDSLLDRTLFALDKEVNRQGRHFLPITIQHEPDRPSFWGMTGGAGIVLFPPDTDTLPPLAQWAYVLLHEVGHLVGIHLLDGDRSESWAMQFQQWAMGGQSEWHPVWQRLESLAPDVTIQ